jgi:hypothetical protein
MKYNLQNHDICTYWEAQIIVPSQKKLLVHYCEVQVMVPHRVIHCGVILQCHYKCIKCEAHGMVIATSYLEAKFMCQYKVHIVR